MNIEFLLLLQLPDAPPVVVPVHTDTNTMILGVMGAIGGIVTALGAAFALWINYRMKVLDKGQTAVRAELKSESGSIMTAVAENSSKQEETIEKLTAAVNSALLANLQVSRAASARPVELPSGEKED